jgi:DNA-directed RNA polymerase specialized sigma54-like protein
MEEFLSEEGLKLFDIKADLLNKLEFLKYKNTDLEDILEKAKYENELFEINIKIKYIAELIDKLEVGE